VSRAHGSAAAGNPESDDDRASRRTANNATIIAPRSTPSTRLHTITPLTSSLSVAQSQAANIDVYEVRTRTGATTRSPATRCDDADQFGPCPIPAEAPKTAGDTPQEVMFFVTDASRPIGHGSRVQSMMDPSYAPRSRTAASRIAVLYTTYLPLPTNSCTTATSPIPAEIASDLENCARRPLFPGLDRPGHSGALTQLFNVRRRDAHLTK